MQEECVMTHEVQESRKAFHSDVKSYFTAPEWVFYFVLIIAGLLLRWIDLAYLPYHHDESIHAMFGQYFYDFPESTQAYKYDPEYHGPTLYMLLRPVYATFGSSDWSGRVPIAILGSLAMLLPFVFRRYLAPTAALFLTAAVALSPTLVYWSRFLREDYIIFLGMFLVLYGATLAKPSARSFFILTGIALDWATKANIFVFLGILSGYLIFEYGFNKFILGEKTIVERAWENVRRYWVQFIGALLAGAFVFTYLITTGYRYGESISNGLGLGKIKVLFPALFGLTADKIKELQRHDVLLYWLDKHAIERIQGPFNFHLYQLAWYELVFMLFIIAHIALFIWDGGKIVRRMAAVVAAVTLLVFLYYAYPAAVIGKMIGHFMPLDPDVLQSGLWKFFKAKDPLDVVGVMILIPYALIVTCTHLWRRQFTLAFFGYYFTATLFSYSYLGEKVPWLSSYPLIGGLIYFTLYFQSYLTEHPIVNWRSYPVRRLLLYIGLASFILGVLFLLENHQVKFGDNLKANAPYLIAGLGLGLVVLADIYLEFLGGVNLKVVALLVLCIFNARLAIIANFPGKDKELGYISQVHTTKEFRDAAKMVRDNIENQVFGVRPIVHVKGEASWPITWYFKGLAEYKFDDSIPAARRNEVAYIFDDWKDDEKQEVPEGFVARRLNLRGWWVPDFGQMTLKKFLNYSVNLEPWSGLGYTYARLLTNKKIIPQGRLLTVDNLNKPEAQ